MKELNVSEQQTEKFNEMCEKLFPKQNMLVYSGSCDYCLPNTVLIAQSIRPRHNDWELIHWFEFCMTHLAEKIFNPNPHAPDRTLKDRLKNFLWESNMYSYNITTGNKNAYGMVHPIDLLYIEFKKL